MTVLCGAVTAAVMPHSAHASARAASTASTASTATTVAQPTESVMCAPQTVPNGGSASCTATVQSATATPTGQVSFSGPNDTAGAGTGAALSFSTPSCTLTSAGAGSATCAVSLSAPPAGCYQVVATYGGDGADTPVAEADAANLVVSASTYAEVPSCASTAPFSDPAPGAAPTYTATCLPTAHGTACGAEFTNGLFSAPTGTVTFDISAASSGAASPHATTTGLSGGCSLATAAASGTLAACSTVLASPPAGDYIYSVTYAGNSLYASRTVSGEFSQASPDSSSTTTPQVEVAITGAGSGGVTSSPAGISCPGHCTARFSKDSLVTLNAVAKPGSAFAGFFGGGCDGPRPCTVTAEEAPTVKAEFVVDTAPAPVNGATVNLAKVSGVIRFRTRPGGRFVTLVAGQTIPVGATIDARHGTVLLTSVAAGNGGRESAIFRAGEFVVRQSSGVKLTVLTMIGGSPKVCEKPVPAVLTGDAKRPPHQPHKRVRRLWGSGKGSFQTDGAYASATVRGTIWQTTDFCDGTDVAVTQGLVAVRDFPRHRTVLVPAGKSHFAAAR